jgi:hypothetical protein
MSLKRKPTDAEIETLAATFRPLWRKGDVVRPWLRQHQDMLLELVHGEWSWAAIGAALSKAGITYRTGAPWTAKALRSEFSRAQAPLKGYRRRPGRAKDTASEPLPVPTEAVTTMGAGVFPPAAAPAAPVISPLPPGPEPSAASGPRFKPASLRVHEAPPVLSEAERAEIERNRRLTFGPPESKE